MANGGPAAARAWARADLRARWRPLVALGLLAGVTAGFAIAAWAGARRTDTALDRLKAVTRAPSAIVFASQSGVFDPSWDALRARPEVADLAAWDLVFGNIDGHAGGVLFASDDGRWGSEVNRPVLVAGRMWDPGASDEIVVDENLAKTAAPLGSTHDFAMVGPTIDDLYANRVDGPTVTLKVVGVVREVRQFLFVTDGQAFLSPGFVGRYRGQGAIHPNADVVLRPDADVAALRQDVNDVIGPGTPVLDLHAVQRRVDTTLAVEHSALLLLGLAIAIAGGLLVAQALIRSASTVGDDALALRSIGMTRLHVATAVGLTHAVTALVAGVTAIAVAIAASGWFPVGIGRRIDPDVGVHADWAVLASGAALAILLVIGGAMLVAARRSSLRHPGETTPASSLVARIRRAAPLTVGLGATLAFERGRGRTSVPVRPALAGAIIGVLGVVGALTIDHGLQDSLAHPERAGVTWDLTVSLPQEARTPDGLATPIANALRDASAGDAAIVDRVLVPVSGVGTPTFAIRPSASGGSTAISFALVHGRAPTNAGELAIGPATANEIHAHIGDTIQIGDPAVTLKVVGEALFPSDVHAEFDEGIWLTPDRLDSVTPPDPTLGPTVALRLPKGTSRDAVATALSTTLPDGSDVSPAEVPVELANLKNVRTLPVLLAGFLALLALGALSHVLLTSARRRGRDFAVLRAFGLPRKRLRMVVNAQATAIGLVGLVVGVPLGVALGRTLWRFVAERVPLADVPPFAVLAVVLIVPLAMVAANLLALWPGRQVVRQQPARVLRSE